MSSPTSRRRPADADAAAAGRALTGELLLEAWEHAAAEDEPRRRLALLSVALPGRALDELARLPVAEITALLLRVHETSFGAVLNGFGMCDRCDAEFEFSLPVTELIADGPPSHRPIAWTDDGREYRLRPVTMLDLLDVIEAAELEAAEDRLLARCLTVAPAGTARAASIRSVLDKFEELHAASELSVTIACPECEEVGSYDLDIGRFLWTEVRGRATHLLAEIDALAGAYGWSEQSILALTPQRRAAYLELVDR